MSNNASQCSLRRSLNSASSSLPSLRGDNAYEGSTISPAIDSKTAKCASPWYQVVPNSLAADNVISAELLSPSALPPLEKSSASGATIKIVPNARPRGTFRPLSKMQAVASSVSDSLKHTDRASLKLAQDNQLVTSSLEQGTMEPPGSDSMADATSNTEYVADSKEVSNSAEATNSKATVSPGQNALSRKSWIASEESETPLHSLRRWMESVADQVNGGNETNSGDPGGEKEESEEEELCSMAFSSFESSTTLARSPSPRDESLARMLEFKGVGPSISPPCSVITSHSRGSSNSSSSSRSSSSEQTTGEDVCNLTPGAGSPVDELFAIDSVESESGEDDADTEKSDYGKKMGHDENLGSGPNSSRPLMASPSGLAFNIVEGRRRSLRSSSVDDLLTHAVEGLLNKATAASEVQEKPAEPSVSAENMSKFEAAAAKLPLSFTNAGLAARVAERADAGAAAREAARAEAAADRAINAAEASRSVVEGGRVATVVDFKPAGLTFASSISPLRSAEVEARLSITPRRRPSIASSTTTTGPAESLLMRRGTVWNGVNWVPPSQHNFSPLSPQHQPPPLPPLSASSSMTQQQQPRFSRSAERRASNLFPVAPTTAAALAVAAATGPVSSPDSTRSDTGFHAKGEPRRSEASASFPTRPAVRSVQPPPLWAKPPIIMQARPQPRRRQVLEAVITGESRSAGTALDRRDCTQNEPPRLHMQKASPEAVPMRRMTSRDILIAQPEETCTKSFAERRRALRQYEEGEQAAYLASLHVPASALVLPSKARAQNGDDKAPKQSDTKSSGTTPAASWAPSSSSSARRASFAASTEAAAAALADVVAALAATAAYEPEAEAVAEAARVAAAARDNDILLPGTKVEVGAEAAPPAIDEPLECRQADELARLSVRAESTTEVKATSSPDTSTSPKRAARDNRSVRMPESLPQPPTSPLTRPCLRARTFVPVPLSLVFKKVSGAAESQSGSGLTNSTENQSKPMATASLRGRRAASPAARERQSRRHENLHTLSGGPASAPAVRLRSRSASPLRVSAASTAALATAAPLVFGDSWREIKRVAQQAKAADLQEDIRRRREHAFLRRTQTTRRPLIVNPSGLVRGNSPPEAVEMKGLNSKDVRSKQTTMNSQQHTMSTSRQPRSQSAPRTSNRSDSSSSSSRDGSCSDSSRDSRSNSSSRTFAVAHTLPSSPLKQHLPVPQVALTPSNSVESRRNLAVGTSPSELLWYSIGTSTSSVAGNSAVWSCGQPAPQRMEAQRRTPFFAETPSPLSAASLSSSLSTPWTVAAPSHMYASTASH